MDIPANIKWKHDVFLSFRGADTRNNFTSHLNKALTTVGIRTFIDDEDLEGGKQIKSELQKAIQESMMSIIVFSKSYASSRWCLDELVMILDCKRKMGQIVLPVFYDVEPAVVRHQTGSYGEAFQHFAAKNLDMLKVNKWRAALKEAADFSGHSLRDEENGNESKFIDKIVMKVLLRVNRKCRILPDNLVGIGSHVSSINQLLNFDLDNDVLTLGIYGMGGVGKTTISKAVFNHNMHRFEACSFVDNVKDEAKLPYGFVRLQENLLSQLLNQNVKVLNHDDGINWIGRICHSKKVLILLDDVDNSKQLKLLAGDNSFFGPGSRIIITTRDMQLLRQASVDKEYEMTGLNEKESLELFSLHAFRKTVVPSEDYRLLSDRVIKYAGGLPVALEVIGSYLIGKSPNEWRSAVDKLCQIPHRDIQEKLKVSFDALIDDKVKDIFLDLACFFNGMDKYFAATIWDGCGLFAEDGIKNLVDKCLVKIDENNELRMHDLLRDMGREIVRNQSLKQPSMRNRLMLTDEGALNVLTNVKATNIIEGISIDHSSRSETIRLDAKIFEAMSSLRLLEIKNVEITGSLKNIFLELRWLSWCDRVSCMPSDLNPRNLVMLDMRNSRFSKVWEGSKSLPNLKILNLEDCEELSETPDFTMVPKLEWLCLRGCLCLSRLHPSIGRLYKLQHLDMVSCGVVLPETSLMDPLMNCFDGSSDTERSDLFLYINTDGVVPDISNLKFLHIDLVDEVNMSLLFLCREQWLIDWISNLRI